MQAKGGLVNQGTAAETRGAVSLADVLRRLGRFLLLTHEGGSARFWELDALRGIPIIMMVIFHLVYDLVLFGFISGEPFEGRWRPASSVIVVQFVALAG
ncbi:MAG: heparan-alpha-glucosaminide N-acetyltransferase domain-containing protein, partial [Anaerolineae bacterium]